MRELNERPIAYYPVYRKITGSTTAGILLSQLMYWFSKKDEFYKTDTDLMDETMLSENELRSAKARIKALDFISIEKRGVPCKTYYIISWEKYENHLREYHLLSKVNSQNCSVDSHETSLVKSTSTVSLNPQDCSSEIHETYNVKSLTKTTTKTTTKNKKNIKKEFSFSLSQSTQLENTTQEYQDKLKGYAVIKDGSYSYESFLNYHLAKGSKFKDWSRAYNTWLSNTQKFNKEDPTRFVRKVEHPKYGFVFVEYGTNRVYEESSLQCVAKMITQTVSEDDYKKQYSTTQHSAPDLSALAQRVRV